MDDEKWHGTLNGYSNYGCRCPMCRAANAAQKRTWRARVQKRRKDAQRTREEPVQYRPKRRRLPDD